MSALQALEQQIATLEETRRKSDQRHAMDIAKAAADFAEHQRLSDTRLAQSAAARQNVEQRLSEVSATLQATERRLSESEAALSQSRQQAIDERQAVARHAQERQNAFDARLAEEAARQEALERRLMAAEDALREAVTRHAADTSAQAERLAIYRMQSEAKLAETAGVRDTLARSLDEAKKAWASEVSAAAQRLAARETELTGELAKAAAVREALEARVAERDAQLKEQAANHRNSQDALQARTSNHIVQLRRELDDTIVVKRSQFEHAPVSLLRCSRSGGIEQVSQVMATTLGYRTPQEAQAVNFATTVFESPNDWQSFIGRCVETGAESLETIWRRKNGTRFVVRLRAVSHASGHIDVAAEDLTNYRELEEKLRRSERMEAVGRLASEVAATCDNLLRDVRQDGQTWLAAMSDDSPMRQQGELLLDDVTRAASFLRQLDVYSKTQADSSEPADLVRVLRNLTPVLKRVAGDDIEFVLPKSPSELTVDVEKETIERILVNVAAYGRERMPFGGRLMFELAKTTVDSQSVASHPNVRPGPHVLITATAVRYAVWSDASRTLPRPLPANKESEAASDRPGVDLGAMQALIQGCGGRLWLTAEPPGDMVLKIHLPRSTPSHAAVARRPMRRWLHAGR
jgi:hypothetical protein